MAEEVKLTVAQETILDLVKGTIQAQLVSALEKDRGSVINAIVKHAMSKQVERGYKTHSFLDLAISDAIEAEAKECMKQWLLENRDKIRSAFECELRRSGTAKKIAIALVDGLVDKVEINLRMDVRVAQ